MYWIVKAKPACGGDHFYVDIVQELHASTTSLISDLGCISVIIFLSYVLSANSSNATTLHSHCI
uniref:Uncharacterized protein n=1 Tax=Arundo donax TaxID=35708 RepID=A0A0A9FG95_ARUDO